MSWLLPREGRKGSQPTAQVTRSLNGEHFLWGRWREKGKSFHDTEKEKGVECQKLNKEFEMDSLSLSPIQSCN